MDYKSFFRKKPPFLGLFFFTIITCLIINCVAIGAVTNNLFQTIEPTSYQQNTTVTISESNLSQDEQLALHYYWQGQYQEALAIWESLLQSSSPTKVAEIHRYLGVAYQDLGQMGRAISHFQEALSIYEAHPSTIEQRQLAEVLIAIGQTQNELGQGKRAIATLRQVISLAEKRHFPVLQTIAYRHLGTAFLIISDFDQAIKSYSRSRELAAVHELPTELVTTLNNLTLALLKRQTLYESQAKAAEVQGNQKEQNRLLFLAQQNHIIATETAKQALDLSQNKPNLATVRAMINLMQLEPQQNFLSQIKNILLSSRPSRSVAQLLQNVAQLESQTEAIKLLERAIDIATNLGDFRTQSYALGHLGHIYEQLGDYSLALEKTQQAQWAAQQVMAADSLYRWQWQAARIFEQTNQDGPAKKAYEGAITTLQKLREEIANASPALQLNVQEDVEPVYRQFLSLLLEKQPNIAELQESLEVINQLQLVELQSFFGDPCLEIRQAQLAQDASLPSHTARIHTLILSKSTQMILELPDGTISSYSVALSANDIEKLIEQWRLQLESSRIPLAYRNLSERFYNLLIKPMSKSLSSASIKHLIFVNDGLLRNVPMVALHDGQKFLIEKYTISNSLGINVQFSQPITNYRGSIFGLSVSVADFPPLPYVPQEIQQIINVVGGEKFIDESFTVLNLKQQISKNFPIIHLATHGYFGGTAKTTFLQSFERPIFLREFEQILSQRTNPIQLLTLSACQTATGNKRAVLGLAGVALRSGVKSVLATLWSVRDKDVVSLLSRFYRYWQQGLSLEEAYQKTLVEVIQQPGTHPKNWSSFVLITN